MAPGGQDTRVGAEHRVGRGAIAEVATVDEEVERATGRLGVVGGGDHAVDPHLPAGPVDRHEVASRVAPQRLGGALPERLPGPRREQHPASRAEREADVGPGQGEAGHGLADMAGLGGRRAHELAAGGGVEEEVAHLDGGAARPGHRGGLERGPTLDHHAGTLPVLARRRVEPQPRDRGDGRHRLATEAHGGDAGQSLGVAELGGGVALEGQQGVVAVHAGTVVGDPDQGEPPLLDVDRDGVGPGVERVLAELLDHRGRSLDHLACGDLVDQPGGQDSNGGHAVF